jgi:hypothetical protein
MRWSSSWKKADVSLLHSFCKPGPDHKHLELWFSARHCLVMPCRADILVPGIWTVQFSLSISNGTGENITLKLSSKWHLYQSTTGSVNHAPELHQAHMTNQSCRMATLWMSEPENVRGKKMVSASELSRLLVGKTPHSTQKCEQLYSMPRNMQFYILRLHSHQLEIHDHWQV